MVFSVTPSVSNSSWINPDTSSGVASTLKFCVDEEALKVTEPIFLTVIVVPVDAVIIPCKLWFVVAPTTFFTVILSPTKNPRSLKLSPSFVVTVKSSPEAAKLNVWLVEVAVSIDSVAIFILIFETFASVVSEIVPTFFTLFARYVWEPFELPATSVLPSSKAISKEASLIYT